MQKACKELKQKLEKARENTLPQQELLEEYKKNPTSELKRKVKESLQKAKEKTRQKEKELKEDLLQKTKELLEEQTYSNKFEGKLKLENGHIVLEGEVYFHDKEEVYLPSVIKTAKEGLYLGGLTPAEYLELPDTVTGHLNLSSLESIEHLDLPDTLKGGLDLKSLKSAEQLELPDTIGGDLDLRNLKSAEHLDLPDKVGGSLRLQSLESTEGLNLSKSNIKIGLNIYLDNLSQKERDELEERYPHLRGQITTWD